MKAARFIAGAACRVCAAIDRIVVEDSSEGRVQRCVSCGHRETMQDATRAIQIRDADGPTVSSSSAKTVTISIRTEDRSDR